MSITLKADKKYVIINNDWTIFQTNDSYEAMDKTLTDKNIIATFTKHKDIYRQVTASDSHWLTDPTRL